MNSIIVTNLSELDFDQKKLFQNLWETNVKPMVEILIECCFSEIVNHYLNSKKKLKKEGAVWLQPKPNTEESFPLSPSTITFKPFDNLLIDCDPSQRGKTEKLVWALHEFTTPECMPLYYVDPIGVSYDFFEMGREVVVDEFLAMIFPDYNISMFTETPQSVKQSKPRQQPEQKLEDGLYDWLRIKGVDVERQVTTAKHRLDLWIPNKAMLELKQGRVSGDDVCQAIDYAATYQMPIVLIGTGLSSAASRGIDGFNRAMGKDLIIFVTWGGVKPYLNGIL